MLFRLFWKQFTWIKSGGVSYLQHFKICQKTELVMWTDEKKSELCNTIAETRSFILQKCGRDKMMFLVVKNLSFEYFDKEILKKIK